MSYPTDLNSPLVSFMIFNFHGLKKPCNSEPVNFLKRSEYILEKGQYCTAQGNARDKCGRSPKLKAAKNFDSYVVQVLLSDHNMPCACVMSVRPSRDPAVIIIMTLIKETHFQEPKHQHLTVGMRHIMVTFTILWPTVSAYP